MKPPPLHPRSKRPSKRRNAAAQGKCADPVARLRNGDALRRGAVAAQRIYVAAVDRVFHSENQYNRDRNPDEDDRRHCETESGAVHCGEILQPVWHLSKDIPGKRRADAGQDLGQARYGKANAECDNKCLSLEAIAQQTVGESDGAPNQQNQDDRDGRWNSQPYQIEQAHIRRPDDKRDRQIQTAKQGHEGLTHRRQSQKRSKNEHRFDICARYKSADVQRRYDKQSGQDHQADESAPVINEHPAHDRNKDDRCRKYQRREKIQQGKKAGDGQRENSEAEGQNQKSRRARRLGAL